MEVLNNDNGNGGVPSQDENKKEEKPRLSHEQHLQQFANDLNGILQKGYPMNVVLQVLESAVFEMRMGLYFAQMEANERAKKNQLQIPKLNIPTGKIK